MDQVTKAIDVLHCFQHNNNDHERQFIQAPVILERRDRSAPTEHNTSETTPVIMKHNEKMPRVVAKPLQSNTASVSPLSPSGTSSSPSAANEMPGKASIPFLDRRHGRMSSDAVIKVCRLWIGPSSIVDSSCGLS